MNDIAIMASFPPRLGNLAYSVPTIARQVDKTYLILNEFVKTPDLLSLPPNVEVVLPPNDLKDTGKFVIGVQESDFIFLCDDDILYAADYCKIMKHKLSQYEHLNAIVGIHGVTYPDFFDGTQSARLVNVFTQSFHADNFVNQLGTGTVACRGFHMPNFEFMRTSARFVDVRFALHCEMQNYPRVCIERQKGWMSELKAGPSLFETFTKGWPIDVIREAQAIAGFRFLHPSALLKASTQANAA